MIKHKDWLIVQVHNDEEKEFISKELTKLNKEFSFIYDKEYKQLIFNDMQERLITEIVLTICSLQLIGLRLIDSHGIIN